MFLLVFVRGNCFHSFGEEHWVVNWVQNFDSLETGFSCGFIIVYVSGFVGFVVSFLSSFLISLCFCSFNSLVWISSFLVSLVFLFFCVFFIFFSFGCCSWEGMRSETMAEWTEEWGEEGMHGDAFLLFNLFVICLVSLTIDELHG